MADPTKLDSGTTADPDAAAGLVDRFVDFVGLGGPVVVVLLVLSISALAIILLKAYQLLRVRASRQSAEIAALGAWRAGHTEKALADAKRIKGPVGRVLNSTMISLSAGNQKKAEVREEATRIAVVELNGLNAYLRGLEMIASISPLLGLFGTVLGMIEAFRQIQGAGNQANASLLAGGIWEALLTTAVGLAVAVPSAMALTAFESRIERIRHIMEDSLTQLFTANRAYPGEACDRIAAE